MLQRRKPMRILSRCGVPAAIFAGVVVYLAVVQRRHDGYSFGLFRQSAVLDSIQVVGDSQFVRVVTDALAHLRANSPAEYGSIHSYVRRIEQSRRSGAGPWNEPPTVYLNARTAYCSPTWCAASIVHDGYHIRLYKDHLAQNGGSVPDALWRGKAAELRCIEQQIRASRHLRAPQYELDYLAALDGTHFDLNGDGEETWYDYWARDW